MADARINRRGYYESVILVSDPERSEGSLFLMMPEIPRPPTGGLGMTSVRTAYDSSFVCISKGSFSFW